MSRLLGGIVAYNDPRIDDVAVKGLAGTFDSMGYFLDEGDHHNHNTNQVYGATSAGVPTMVRRSVVPIGVTGGNASWGTELVLHNGTTIEGGSTVKQFDLQRIYVYSVGTANRVTVFQFLDEVVPAPIACTFQDAGDTVTKNTHGLVLNEKVTFPSVVTTTGVNVFTNYFVINPLANTFQISLTRGGAAAPLTTNGSGTYASLGVSDADGLGAGQLIHTESVISKAAVNSDVNMQLLQSFRKTCNTRISCRGWADAGTNLIGFFLGLHTYPS